ncbi:MAG: type II CRISPR-associated endonuclease Cas1 [Cytophagales bacterium]|jgi:CRISPR-associated protein Cas1|nr:type II CRISPR-associated endonuclease Cas1 [Cytophagales bacterium]MCA6388606.1 type II CRISPR-associated endonuclease Cas1 [Cytophagales bacterium]MCA6390255.1 type II CRISPR-associated endonuclease Cas1 [Cytophagales bacterium]MCA6399923.1 type II CRISPR-associated endonuclease Cas1 [Cytophagales bacterium]MCA6403066.1 type II CRISPR-associated endonuclease Cas1 [Cytophagales bacterium]
MIKRTLYFGNPAYLSTKLDQLVVRLPAIEKNSTLPDGFKKEAAATIPIEDIGVVMLDHQQIIITQALIAKLLDNNAAIITCNSTHHPTGLLLNLEGHSLQSQRFQAQLDATEPLRKQLWQQTIRAKILNQAAVLRWRGYETQNMQHWADNVKSGDPENLEGRAAAWYWSHLFKELKTSLPFDDVSLTDSLAAFIREPAGLPPNQLLNYAYALLRATMARSLVGSGLLPIMGIFHRNQYNAYCLADDMMEPYRPFADKLIVQLIQEEGLTHEISTATKKKLLTLPALDIIMQGETSPLMIAMQRTSASLAKCFLGETRKVMFPSLDIGN